MKIVALGFLAFSFFSPSQLLAQEMWLVWSEPLGTQHPVYFSHLEQGKWETEQLPGSSFFSANYMPCLGVDLNGDPWIVWAAQKDQEDAKIYFSRRRAQWTEPRRLSISGKGWESHPTITFDPQGKAWAAWAGDGGKSSEIFCAAWQESGFGPATMVSKADDSPDARPVISMDEKNCPMVVWQGWTGREPVFYQSRFQNGVWNAEASIGLPSQVAGPLFPEGSIPSPDSLPRSADFLAGKGARLILRNQAGGWETQRRIGPSPSPPLPAGVVAAASPAPLAENEYTGYGDSITYGEDGRDDDGWYGSLLKGMLEALYPGHTFYFHNDGYPGARTYQLLNGGELWRSHCPGIDVILRRHASSVILIMGGTNDIEDGDDYQDMKWNLQEMIKRVQDLKYQPILATIIPRWDTNTILKRSEKLNLNYIRPLAIEQNVLLADPWQIFQDYGDYHSLYKSDKIHPKWPAGCQKIADAWFTVVPPPPEPLGPLDKIIKWSRDWATGL